ncbi:hypothetical protein Ancab_032386 [Ancistrocladus abbreviatus]
MTRNQIIIRPTTVYRRQPLLDTHKSSSTGSARLAEVAGGTLAECTAICCCCPCGLVTLLVLAVYKVPAGLCRKILRTRRRRRLIKKGLMPLESNPVSSRLQRCGGLCGCDETELHIHPVAAAAMALEAFPDMDEVFVVGREVAMEKELVELEKQMWDRFYGTGFWRSLSQRET